jgi:hypothetical protein
MATFSAFDRPRPPALLVAQRVRQGSEPWVEVSAPTTVQQAAKIHLEVGRSRRKLGVGVLKRFASRDAFVSPVRLSHQPAAPLESGSIASAESGLVRDERRR